MLQAFISHRVKHTRITLRVCSVFHSIVGQMVSELSSFVSAIDCEIDKTKCGRQHSGARQNGKKMRWMVGLSMVAALAGCGADTQYDNESANAEVEVPAAPVDPTLQRPTSYDAWANRDRNAPFQTVKLGETVVRVPTGYIRLLDMPRPEQFDKRGEAALQTTLLLETLLPGFPTHSQYKNWKNPGGNSGVYVRFSEVSSASRLSLTDEEAVLRHQLFHMILGTAPRVEELSDLELKRYSNKASPHGEVVYIPVGDQYRAPNGDLMPIICPPRARSSIDSCRVGYLAADELSVNYSFPFQYLARWKDVRQFVLDTVQIVR